ncbi:toll/interleukin-1 receptor domain-containing protein [Rhodococcus jostii]|uniref:toll/interleukin-1 receptor domain-containing protein n=1 Tax=Rhodococcus jostii TaxID=132919 RepID=UPI0009D7703F
MSQCHRSPLSGYGGETVKPLRIFVNYRRDKDLMAAILVTNRLESSLNNEHARVQVFMDTRQRVGHPWPKGIREEIEDADIVLVLIGPEWLEAERPFRATSH